MVSSNVDFYTEGIVFFFGTVGNVSDVLRDKSQHGQRYWMMWPELDRCRTNL